MTIKFLNLTLYIDENTGYIRICDGNKSVKTMTIDDTYVKKESLKDIENLLKILKRNIKE